MKYTVFWRDKAEEDLQQLPVKTSTAIVRKVESYLSLNPKKLGEPLTGNFAGYYRYRMGDYRVIYEIDGKAIIIYVLHVGHRKHVYR
jgi:mRNA interferase RelE/StbE